MARLEAVITPCNYIHQQMGDIGDVVAPECISDPEKQFEYLSTSIQMVILHNVERLDLLKFGNDKIVKESIIKDLQFDPRIPTWVEIAVQQEELEDETAFIQYGQQTISNVFDMIL